MLLFQKISRPALVSFLLLAACSKAPDRPAYGGLPNEPVAKSFKIQVKSPSEGSDQDLSDLSGKFAKTASKVGCSVDTVQPIAWESGALSEELSQSYHVSLKDCDLDLEGTDQALVAFSEEPYVASAEAEAKIRVNFSENDQGKAQQDYLPQISRDDVCDLLPKDAPEVIVAVIDSGVERDHPDLVDVFARDNAGNIIGANFVGKGSRGQPDANWDDQNGHGTHVSGIIAASGNNEIGITGVASCANVKVMPIRVLNASGSGSSIEIDRAVQWAMAHGAHIINLSLGSNSTFRSPRTSHPNALYEEAAARGVTVFAAAGNENLTLGRNANGYIYSYPASFDNVISVAATDSQGRLANFSNRGETVDIAAPGVQILSTYPGKSYRRQNGTSMASPVAAGAYALALAASHRKSKPSVEMVESALLQAVAAKTLSADDVHASGVIDTKVLVGIIGQPNPSEPELTPVQPVEENPVVDEPAEEVKPQGMVFSGLTDGMSWAKARKISVQGWPEGKTARVYLYWLSSSSRSLSSFVMLDRNNLSDDGSTVTTSSAYRLYGEGKLIAEAVDSQGNTLGTSEIKIEGL